MRLCKLLLTMLIAIFVVTNVYAISFPKTTTLYRLKFKYQYNPYGLAKWLDKEIVYRRDKEDIDEWQTPQRTFERRKGDCEDYAILAKYVLGRGNILCVRNKEDKRHAVLIFWNNKKLYMLSNHNLKYLGRKRLSYYRLAEMVFSDWRKWDIVDTEGYIIKGRYRPNVQD